MSYAEQWPHLAQVTNDLDIAQVTFVGANLENYSVEVQIDYADYTAFIIEYSDYIDSSEPAYDW